MFYAVFLPVTALLGCSSNNVADGVAKANNANIKRAANLYASYAAHNGSQGPKGEDDLKRYVHDELAPKKLEMMGIDSQNLDAVFISERDHKPFKVQWGLVVPPTASVAVVFETDGVGGVKQVATTGGEVKDVSDAEYQSLWGEKPSAAAASAGPPVSEKSSDRPSK